MDVAPSMGRTLDQRPLYKPIDMLALGVVMAQGDVARV
jgi:hypothetical protein